MVNIIKQEGLWRINGAMGMSQIEHLLAQANISSCKGSLLIDLAEATEVDTATISLLMEWLREAKSTQCHLQYQNLPKNLTALATLYGVLEMIPVVSSH